MDDYSQLSDDVPSNWILDEQRTDSGIVVVAYNPLNPSQNQVYIQD